MTNVAQAVSLLSRESSRLFFYRSQAITDGMFLVVGH